jgi:hypothetical protein
MLRVVQKNPPASLLCFASSTVSQFRLKLLKSGHRIAESAVIIPFTEA